MDLWCGMIRQENLTDMAIQKNLFIYSKVQNGPFWNTVLGTAMGDLKIATVHYCPKIKGTLTYRDHFYQIHHIYAILKNKNFKEHQNKWSRIRPMRGR
jgi:hypothetical protein